MAAVRAPKKVVSFDTLDADVVTHIGAFLSPVLLLILSKLSKTLQSLFIEKELLFRMLCAKFGLGRSDLAPNESWRSLYLGRRSFATLVMFHHDSADIYAMEIQREPERFVQSGQRESIYSHLTDNRAQLFTSLRKILQKSSVICFHFATNDLEMRDDGIADLLCEQVKQGKSIILPGTIWAADPDHPWAVGRFDPVRSKLHMEHARDPHLGTFTKEAKECKFDQLCGKQKLIGPQFSLNYYLYCPGFKTSPEVTALITYKTETIVAERFVPFGAVVMHFNLHYMYIFAYDTGCQIWQATMFYALEQSRLENQWKQSLKSTEEQRSLGDRPASFKSAYSFFQNANKPK